MSTLAPTLIAVLVGTMVTGCDRTRDCPVEVKCPTGKTCRCDAQGRLASSEIREKGRVEVWRYTYDASGRLVSAKADIGDNGSVDVELGYEYDSAGRRVASRGRHRNCNGRVNGWECRYEEPCPAPYEECKPCRKPEAAKRPSLEPCDEKTGTAP